MKNFISIGFFLFTILISHSLYSATFYVSPTGSGTDCSSSVPCSLDQALSTAASNDSDNTVSLSAGTYTSITEFAYTAASLNHSLTLIGAGQSSTFVTSTGGNGIIFTFSGTITVSGITVQSSGSSGLRFVDDPDGTSFNVAISNCTFSSNGASGVWIENTGTGLAGIIQINHNTFEGNTTGTTGGGLHIRGDDALITFPIQINNNIFTQNHADGNGGAVWITHNATDSPITFQGNTVQNNNSLATSGGVYILSVNSSVIIGGSSTSVGNSFSYNTGNDTGAVWSQGQTDGMTFQNNTVIGNTGFTGGGAINLRIYAGDIIFSNNVIQNNPTFLGGGFQVQTIDDTRPITFTMNANLVSGNSSTDFGGGSLAFDYLTSPAVITNNIFVENFGASSSASVGGFGISSSTNQAINLTNNTFANNISNSFSGGLFLAPNNAAIVFNLYNNLFWENLSAFPQEADLYVFSPIWTGMNLYNNDLASVCVEGTPTTCNNGSNFSTLANTTASGNLYNIDPLFVGTGNLVNYYSLQRNSPVIKQGDSNALNLPAYDYTGIVPMDSPPDLGALQYVNPDVLSGGCTLHTSERNSTDFFWIYAWILLLILLKNRSMNA